MNDALRYASRIAYSSEAVLQFTYDQAVKYKDSPGVYVEAGVAAGAQIIAMAAGAPNKTIYAFDSFEGIPLPSNKDNQMPGIRMLSSEEQSKLPNPGEQVLESSGATSVFLEDFINHLKAAGVYSDKIIPVRGWFEDTTAGIPKGHVMDPISILRLDGDLYNSTYVCLQNLYPLCRKGALIIIDDWALPGCRQAFADYLNEMDLDTPWFQSIVDENSHVIYWTK
jgi:predicted O-methyltransferase YrrM